MNDIIAQQSAQSRWGDEGYNFFTSGGARDIKQPQIALGQKIQGFRDAYTETALYNMYRRIGSEISPDVATLFSRQTGFDYSFLPGLRNMVNSSVAVVQVPEHALGGLSRSGQFMNQFSTGQSMGAYWPDGRVLAEWRSFDIPLSAGPSDRPIYGYLAYPELSYDDVTKALRRDFGPSAPEELLRGIRRNMVISSVSASQYGDFSFVLKPEYKNSSTFMFDDSLQTISFGIPASNPNIEDMFLAGVESIAKSKVPTIYTEAHIYPRGATIYDMVDYVVVTNNRDAAKIREVFGDSFDVRVRSEGYSSSATDGPIAW